MWNSWQKVVVYGGVGSVRVLGVGFDFLWQKNISNNNVIDFYSESELPTLSFIKPHTMYELHTLLATEKPLPQVMWTHKVLSHPSHCIWTTEVYSCVCWAGSHRWRPPCLWGVIVDGASGPVNARPWLTHYLLLPASSHFLYLTPRLVSLFLSHPERGSSLKTQAAPAGPLCCWKREGDTGTANEPDCHPWRFKSSRACIWLIFVLIRLNN